MKSMLNFASPTHFLRLARVLIPVSAALTALLLGVGLYLAFFVAPPDYQQGETVRIMYLHVPAAWLAMLIYFVMTSAALGTLVWRHPLADAAQKAAAEKAAADRFAEMGTRGVGHLVDLGCAADLGSRAIPNLSRPCGFVAND